MSKQSIKATIDANIKQNGVRAITGQIMNSVLNQMVDNLAEEASTTAKFTELEKQISEIAGDMTPKFVAITYEELKSLRDNGQLIPGTNYRITDYTCTTTQQNTQSAGHLFDIIVNAINERFLNEDAKAMMHNGDTYFANANLSVWELKYCLDNDGSRFAWADPSGKGVIYWMKDEWGNECPYDFKNIMFKRYLDEEAGYYKYDVSQSNNKWCYTFCMVDFIDGESHDVSVEQSKYIADGKYYKTYHNKLAPCFQISDELQLDEFVQVLNDVVFVTDTNLSGIAQDYSSGMFYGFIQNTFGNSCRQNTFGNFCSFNTFGNSCSQNTFGNFCLYNTFGNRCEYNTFGDSCSNNTFVDDCRNNTFGNSCSQNTSGNFCEKNTFADNCRNNTFGNSCSQNTFGNACEKNTFGDSCSQNTLGAFIIQNTFGNFCENNTFGNSCSQNTFGNKCEYNTFGDSCYNNTFVDDCRNNTFGNRCEFNTFGNSCHHVRFIKSYFYYVYLEQGVSYVDVTCSATTSVSDIAQNIHINAGVKGTSSKRKVCKLTSVNNAYLTTFGSVDDTKINV